ncbi:MAG: glycosyltransferase family 39 protein [Kiritimatiellia bacterium]|nr:glycosyltransferase family 39 protein [Kiritimatiellia bacterium]MDP6811436.1 glycosyltransferase family 39 protein [Kiritimatiellia bacterium]MDP7024504.1 glycosyltransferase family 39 protein [Kiritimatiellia bacterium]
MKKTVIIGILLFVATATVYWKSIPHSFNTHFGNKRFFDSDGEFIVRQYREGKTFTHNDHVLYHVLGKVVQQNSGSVPSLKGDIVRSHKFLSVAAGALGIVLLYLMGLHMTSRQLPAVLGALLVGGSAGWWFFSSSIDTYLPCALATTAALGAALLVVKTPSLHASAALGALIGLAFLLRTDSVLLAMLGLSLLSRREGVFTRVGVAVAAGLIVGVIGYFVLAHVCYDVAWADVPQWARGALARPETQQKQVWGVTGNLTRHNVLKVLVNHLCYTVVFPELPTTHWTNVVRAYTPAGLAILTGYIIVMTTAAVYTLARMRAGVRAGNWAILILSLTVFLWLAVRILFYSWWDPDDPFLFSAMTIPALWLLLMLGAQQAYLKHDGARIAEWSIPAALLLLTGLVWVHNFRLLIVPLQPFA